MFALGLNLAGFAADPTDPTDPTSLPTVRLLATDPIALAGTSSGAFTIVRTDSAASSLLVSFTLGGTATNGVDYKTIPTEITIPAGYWAEDVVIEPLINAANRGNKTITVKLVANTNLFVLGSPRTAVLRLVDDTFNDVAPAVHITAPTDGATFDLPAIVTVAAEATDPDDPIQSVSFFADDTLLGRTTAAPFSVTWTNPPPGSHSLFARATDQLGKSTISSPVRITVRATAPSIALTTPTDGQVFPIPATVTITANVTKGSGAIARVLFRADDRPLATVTAEPYTFVWTRATAGNHVITATVVDEFGLSATASTHITVRNAPPIVALTKPAAGASFAARSTIELAADASDPDGTVARVAFYADNRLLGTDTTAPYTLSWKAIPAGTYRLTAVAIDDAGQRTTSPAIAISVTK